jgi:copper chaperone CopZ
MTMYNSPTIKSITSLTILTCLSLIIQANALAAEVKTNNLCSSEGALGIRFGDSFSGPRVQGDIFHFGRGCYLIKPPITLPYFDTYTACVSEIDEKIYSIQASKEYDVKPNPVTLELSPDQVNSNRELGKKALEEILAELPPELSAKADIKEKSWKVEIDAHVTLEVSNFVTWSLGFTCQNEAVTVKLFKKRIWGY